METWLFSEAKGIVRSNFLLFVFKITKSPGQTGAYPPAYARMAQELPIGIGT